MRNKDGDFRLQKNPTTVYTYSLITADILFRQAIHTSEMLIDSSYMVKFHCTDIVPLHLVFTA